MPNIIHIDRALTNISVAFMQDSSVFIADKVFPMIPVNKQSDTYFTYKREDFFRDDAQERAKGTESAGGRHNVDTAPPYYCRVYAFHEDVDERDRVNADDPLQPNQDATEVVSHKLLLRREIIWASAYFQPGKWGTEYTGITTLADGTVPAGQTIRWDELTSDPVNDIKKAAIEMARRTGKKPNTLVLSPYAMNALEQHEDILDRIKYTQTGIVSSDLIASLFGVDNIYVPWAIKTDTGYGEEGQLDFIMGKHALLCYVEKKPGIKKASAGYIFGWKGYKGAGALGNRVSRIPMPWLGEGLERIEGEMAFDMQIVAKDLGVFFKDIVS